jgi:uncharacterized protein (TIGR03435 family)
MKCRCKFIFLVIIVFELMAQVPPGSKPPHYRYDVVSIRRSSSSAAFSGFRSSSPGTLSLSHLTSKNLIWLAYSLRPDQIIQGPEWTETETFDIEAKVLGGVSSIDRLAAMEQQRAGLQFILADRFKLICHHSARTVPVYILTAAVKGTKMTAWQRGATPPPGEAIFTWKALVSQISSAVDRPVIDRTGLAPSSVYVARFSYLRADGTGAGSANPIADSPPSVFTAVREQLGLKLTSGTGPVDYLIIDSIQHPTDN